jgi:hypothetical protein
MTWDRSRLPPGAGRDQLKEDQPSFDEQMNELRIQAARRRKTIQRKAARDSAAHARIPEGGGAPLAEGVRSRMEPQIGADLSHVRVHTGGESAAAAEQLGARAFTTGSDVHFGAGEYAPGSKEGDRLIAHELTHAVQGQKPGIQRKADPAHDTGEHDVSHPSDPAEKEADAIGDRAADALHGAGDAKGKIAPPARAPTAAVGRKIHLAEKNPADAAVKRMGQSGQDKHALQDSLKKIEFEKGTLVDELTQLQTSLPSLGLPKARVDEVNLRVRASVRAVQDHLTAADITGAMRDTAGDPVRQSGSGESYDHLQEVNSALASLTRTRTELSRVRAELQRRQTDPKILAEKLNPALDAITHVVQSVQQALAKVKP